MKNLYYSIGFYRKCMCELVLFRLPRVFYLNYNYNYMQCSKPWDFLVKNLRRVHSVHLYLPRSSSTYWIPWKWRSGRCAPRPKAPGFCHASARRDLDKWNLHRLIIDPDPQKFKLGKCISTSKYDFFGICSVRKMYLPSNWKKSESHLYNCRDGWDIIR